VGWVARVAVLELSWAKRADETSDKKTTKIGDEIFRILKAILHAPGFEISINAGFVFTERKTAVFLRTQRQKATTKSKSS